MPGVSKSHFCFVLIIMPCYRSLVLCCPFHSQTKFYEQAATGTLPSFSWFSPPAQACDHPVLVRDSVAAQVQLHQPRLRPRHALHERRAPARRRASARTC